MRSIMAAFESGVGVAATACPTLFLSPSPPPTAATLPFSFPFPLGGNHPGPPGRQKHVKTSRKRRKHSWPVRVSIPWTSNSRLQGYFVASRLQSCCSLEPRLLPKVAPLFSLHLRFFLLQLVILFLFYTLYQTERSTYLRDDHL